MKKSKTTRRSGFMPALGLATMMAATTPVGAQDGGRTLQVVSGTEVRVSGGEQVCFELSRHDFRAARIEVGTRFSSGVYRGHVVLDAQGGPTFAGRDNVHVFRVDPHGVHRLRLELEDPAMLRSLTISADRAEVREASCADFEADRGRRVDLEPEGPAPVNRLEPGTGDAPDRAHRDDGSRDDHPFRDEERFAVQVPAGTNLELLLQDRISSETARPGRVFWARLRDPVRVNGRTVISSDARVFGRIVDVEKGRFGRSKLQLEFDQVVTADGSRIPLDAQLRRLGPGSAKKKGGIIAGSAAGGALLGQLLGGDTESTLLGAIVGGGIAAGVIGSKKGEPVVLEPGTAMTIELEDEMRVPPEAIPRAHG